MVYTSTRTRSAVAAMEAHRADAGVVQSGIQLLKILSMQWRKTTGCRVSGSGVVQTLAIVGRRETRRGRSYEKASVRSIDTSSEDGSQKWELKSASAVASLRDTCLCLCVGSVDDACAQRGSSDGGGPGQWLVCQWCRMDFGSWRTFPRRRETRSVGSDVIEALVAVMRRKGGG
jgi:hypothetical protein